MKLWTRCFTLVMVIGFLAAVAPSDIVITDENATAVFDLTSPAGMKDWTVDGVDHIARQWFWYRLGGEGGESSIDALSLDFSATSDTNYDGQDETLFARYLGNGFKIELTFLLTGGLDGSGWSDMGESIKIVNTGTTEILDFHFFQYCNFDLNNTAADESVEITGGNTATQHDAGATMSETVETPLASHYEVGVYSNTFNSLTNGTPTTLGDVAGPLTDGNLTWAFQWDFTLSPGDTVLISKDKLIVPEPASASLLLLGAVAMLRRRKK